MIEIDATIQAKLDALRHSFDKRVAEVVAVYWPLPTGARYYATSQLDAVTPGIPVSPIEARLIPEDLEGNLLFQTVTSDSSLSDEEVDLNFWDGDGQIADLAYLHGEGVRVEIYYWFPSVELLLSQWWGHLRTPEDADSETFTCRAAVGFRSPLLPLPRRAYFDTCQAIYGGLLTSLAEIAENDCPVNIHLPGGTIGILIGGQPQMTCSRKSRAVCTAHIGDALSYLGDETPVQTVTIGQTQGPALVASSRSTTSNLKNPRRVIFGRRVVRGLDLLAYTPGLNTNHPDQGFVQVLFSICEGRVRGVSGCKVNNLLIAAMHLNTRNGARRQSPTSFSSAPSNYSGTALFYANYGPVNAAQYGPSNLNGEATIDGLDEIRIYTAESVYTKNFTTNRAWCLMEMYRNRRWGHGLDDARFVVSDWITLATWCDEGVTYTDPGGTLYTLPARSTFNAELNDRTAQQQINDVCLAGRFSLPFQYQGKIRILPLKSESLDDVKTFTDYGTERNICVDENQKSTLTRSQISDQELPNQIVLTFEDAARGNIERPLTFSDTEAQLRAGRSFGDTSIRVVEKKYAAVGVTAINEAVRLGNLLLDLGEFDTGGLRNNLRVTFTTWYAETLGLHQYKVIRVLSRQLARYGFEYFRIMTMERQPDLKVTITAQAYPADYYDEIETVLPPASDDYEAESEFNTRTGSAVVTSDAACSGGAKVTGLGNGSTLRFNSVVPVGAGAHDITIFYKSPTTRKAYISVNGGAAILWNFPATIGTAVGQQTLIRSLVAGVNTITFSHPTEAAPDLDKIQVERHQIEPIEPTGGGGPGGGGPCRAGFGDVTFENGQLRVPVLPCV